MPDRAPAAVFLSYASQDAEAARRMCEALRAAGVEVWFDQSELVGGDAWDAKIRGQIGSCALFVPLISANTQARQEGYFRLEWKLAEDRSHLMAKGKPFIVPVSVDGTSERGALVPDAFLAVQWTKLPGGETSAAFVARVSALLGGSIAGPVGDRAPGQRPGLQASPLQESGMPSWAVAVLGGVMLALIAFIALRPTGKESPTASGKPVPETKPAPTASPSTAAPALGEKSVAVLPFANLSSEKENEFFADGVQDDVITNLAKIRDLTVISRTSTLAYRDAASRNLKKIAGELGVATVLEGSVRRVGSKVHMNAQLIDARTDAHLWAETFDGDAGDIFALQASLAQKIAVALKATLTPGERTLIERRPTQNHEAYELYSRARLLDQALPVGGRRDQYEPVISLYEQAVALDPSFALAFANLTRLHGRMYWFSTLDSTSARRARAQAALDAAQRLAPAAPETSLARGMFAYYCDNDWGRALAEYTAAEPLLPNDAQLHASIGTAERRLGRLTEAAVQFERSVALNPQDLVAASSLSETLHALRRYTEARTLTTRVLALFPNDPGLSFRLLRAQFALDGDQAAYLRGYAALPIYAGATSPNYLIAILNRDYAAADRMLGDPRVATLAYTAFANATGGTVGEPAVLLRAELAFLRGEPDLARKYAEEAIAYYRAGSWTKRQQPAVPVELARADALAGRVEAALRDGPGAVGRFVEFDRWAGVSAQVELGRIYLICGKRADALDCLRRIMAAPGASPNEIRLDPIWSRLKGDPRFEEILKSAKVF